MHIIFVIQIYLPICVTVVGFICVVSVDAEFEEVKAAAVVVLFAPKE